MFDEIQSKLYTYLTGLFSNDLPCELLALVGKILAPLLRRRRDKSMLLSP